MHKCNHSKRTSESVPSKSHGGKVLTTKVFRLLADFCPKTTIHAVNWELDLLNGRRHGGLKTHDMLTDKGESDSDTQICRPCRISCGLLPSYPLRELVASLMAEFRHLKNVLEKPLPSHDLQGWIGSQVCTCTD